MSRHELTTEQATAVREDFLSYCEFMNITLYDWQKEAFTEATRRENGKFVYRVAGISVPRGNGKSRGGAHCGEHFCRQRQIEQGVYQQ